MSCNITLSNCLGGSISPTFFSFSLLYVAVVRVEPFSLNVFVWAMLFVTVTAESVANCFLLPLTMLTAATAIPDQNSENTDDYCSNLSVITVYRFGGRFLFHQTCAIPLLWFHLSSFIGSPSILVCTGSVWYKLIRLPQLIITQQFIKLFNQLYWSGCSIMSSNLSICP